MYLCYSLYCIMLGVGELLDNSRNIVCVCVEVFLCDCVCGMCVCVFVCVREIVSYVESGCDFGPRPCP